MVSYFNRPPRPGSTDEAAQKLLRMLEREEREAAELKRLKESGWQPPQQPASPNSGDVAFGDGRDAIVDQVQAGLDYRNALRAEAQRRARVAATPAVWAAPSNGSFGDDDPRVILAGDSKPAGGGAKPAATPYEMTPALAQWMGLGMGAAGVALSMHGMDRAAHHWLNRRDHAVAQDVGDYPLPWVPAR
jgi:hypothetical protein